MKKNISICLNGHTMQYSVIIEGVHMNIASDSAKCLFDKLKSETNHGEVLPIFGTEQFDTASIYWHF